LRRFGASVVVSENGLLGIDEALKAERDGTPFDAVLMDMQMPVLDGYSAARRLRERGYPRPIIALTAHALVEERGRCLAAGCDDYASKPIDREVLLDIVLRQVKRRRLVEAGAASGCF
jgi:Amt family ammonium transporter